MQIVGQYLIELLGLFGWVYAEIVSIIEISRFQLIIEVVSFQLKDKRLLFDCLLFYELVELCLELRFVLNKFVEFFCTLVDELALP